MAKVAEFEALPESIYTRWNICRGNLTHARPARFCVQQCKPYRAAAGDTKVTVCCTALARRSNTVRPVQLVPYSDVFITAGMPAQDVLAAAATGCRHCSIFIPSGQREAAGSCS